MGAHLIDGEFQSDKYPTTPRGKVPLSVKDPSAQDLLWAYAQRRRPIDNEFAGDLETALLAAGYVPRAPAVTTGLILWLEGPDARQVSRGTLFPIDVPQALADRLKVRLDEERTKR